MGKSKKTKGHKSSRNNTSSTAGPLIDKLLPKGLKGLQQTIFWKSNSSNADKTSAAKMDDQVSTGTLSSQGSAVNVAIAATSGSTHNMLPPIILGAQKLNSDSAKSVTSSGYGSLPGSTRNSVMETSLPPVPGHPNMYGSDSDIVHKSSPDTSPLAAKKWSVSGYRQPREEPSSRVPRNSRHKMSIVSTYSIPSRPSLSSNYSFTPMHITQLAHKQSGTADTISPSHVTSHSTQRVVIINKHEYSLTSALGHTNIEVRESRTRNRKFSDIHSKKPPLPNRTSIISLPPLDERDKEPNPRPQRSSYSFNTKMHAEKENLVVTASRLNITSNNSGRRSSTTNHSENGHRRSVHRISITSVDDCRVPASNCPPAIIEEPVQRPTSKRRYGTIMLESPRLSVIQRADDDLAYEKSAQGAKGRRESLVVPDPVPQIIFISPTPDPCYGTNSPSSSTTSPCEQR